jgi:transposase InsO family protein
MDLHPTQETHNTFFIPIQLKKNLENPEKTKDRLLQATKDQKHDEVDVRALLDSGATSSFIDHQFCQEHSVPLQKKEKPENIYLIDGNKHSAGKVIYETKPLTLKIGHNHQETIKFNVSQFPETPVILGLSWLKKNNPDVDWVNHHINLASETISCHSRKSQRGPSLKIIQQELAIEPGTDQVAEEVLPENQENREFKLHQDPIMLPNQFEDEDDDPTPLQEILVQLPPQYHEYAEVFLKSKADILPEHRPFDCEIKLKDEKAPLPFKKIYNLSPVEQDALKTYINEMLKKTFIRPSKSSAGAPIFFVPKPQTQEDKASGKPRALRPCVDYSELNELTEKDRYPLPLIDDMIDLLVGSTIFSKIDLRSAFNLVRMKESDVWKTAFRTRYGLFEYLVMPYGLTNNPAIFQRMMNTLFSDCIDVFVVVYIDDILIFSKSEAEHIHHVKHVLQILQDNNLYAKIEKSLFHQKYVEFVGYEISSDGIRMNQGKLSTVTEWPQPKTVKQVQKFLGLTNYYRRFVKNYSAISKPLTDLTKKNQHFVWNSNEQKAFETLKSALVTSPVLQYPDPSKQFYMETDASVFALGVALHQKNDEDDDFHPVAFYSRKFTSPEQSYNTHDQELLAIVSGLTRFRHLLSGSAYPILISSDHRNLLFFRKNRWLKPRHARWNLTLSEFDFTLKHIPGIKNGAADALSRRQDYIPEKGHGYKKFQKLLPENKWDLETLEILKQNNEEIPEDDPTVPGKHSLKAADLEEEQPEEEEIAEEDDNRIEITEEDQKLKILKARHDSKLSGHPGESRTYHLVSKDYKWKGLRKYVKDYVKSCDTCQRIKTTRHAPYGKLQQIPTPVQPWKFVHMDFITKLPESNGYDSILVVRDRTSKMVHLLPCHTTITASETAELYINNVTKHHGNPEKILTDRDPLFTSKFWKEYLRQMGIKRVLTTAYHPEANAQVERINHSIQQYLRAYVNYAQTNWREYLTFAEIALNRLHNSATNCTAYMANYGFEPNFDGLDQPITSSETVPAVEEKMKLLRNNWKLINEHLTKAFEQSAETTNQRRKQKEYSVGDQVMLNKRNLATYRPSWKLDHQRMGPYKISEKVNEVTYRLTLPPELKIHDAFHVSLLEPYVPNQLPNRVSIPPPPELINDLEHWEIETVLAERTHRRRKEYLIKWKGYPDSDNSWEPASDIEHLEIVQAWIESPQQNKRNPIRTRKRRKMG